MKIDVMNFLDKEYKEKYIVTSKNKITVNACNQYRKPVLIRRYWNLDKRNNILFCLAARTIKLVP